MGLGVGPESATHRIASHRIAVNQYHHQRDSAVMVVGRDARDIGSQV
jgi:hypothetical protein